MKRPEWIPREERLLNAAVLSEQSGADAILKRYHECIKFGYDPYNAYRMAQRRWQSFSTHHSAARQRQMAGDPFEDGKEAAA